MNLPRRNDLEVCQTHAAYPNRHIARLAKRNWTRILKQRGEWSIHQCMSVFRCRLTGDHYHVGKRRLPWRRWETYDEYTA